jgi:glycosyltransferase involved in cell wall biosynthesis
MSKKLNILHFSSHYEDCGIAKYQEQFFDGMQDSEEVSNTFFEYSPYQTRIMYDDELESVFAKLREELKNYDILHIQHEFGFFSRNEFKRLIETAKALDKKVVVTIHAAPSTALKPKELGGYSPRNVVKHLRNKKHNKHIFENHLNPLRQVDLVLVHNEATKNNILDESGISKDKVKQIVHPVPKLQEKIKSSVIKDGLNLKDGDIVYATIGFLHKYKGIDKAIKALKFLPPNYKLAVIGGMHATTTLNDIKLYDKISDLIVELNLENRVFITGFIKDDNELSGLIQEVDICVYAYDGVYYGSVSSGALNLAMANDKAIITYPTLTLTEMSKDETKPLVLTKTFSYYELARELKRIDTVEQRKHVASYAQKYSWPKLSLAMIDIYQSL